MREDCQDDRSETVEALNEIKAMVREGIGCVESGNLRRFGELLHEAWTTKQRLADGVSNPSIDALYARARECGAVGGKVTGAGGGGFLMVYCEEEDQPAVRAAMREAGAREMLFSFDHDGVQVVYDDPFFGAGDAAEAQWKLVRFE
jgi:D-glycero-alpha-D-manno-heptose-7-phosphate kinase